MKSKFKFIAKFTAKCENDDEANQMDQIVHKIYDPVEILKKK